MKLYLSSISIPNDQLFIDLFDMSRRNKIAVIPNAWTSYPQEKSLPYVETLTNKLQTLGFDVVTIDLLQYVNRTDELKQFLEGLQGVWITGGNTFYLNWAIRQSGFDTIILDLMRNGLVYGGESAGAVVAGKTLHGIENLDNPQDAPEIIWDGLGLVDFGLVPHWNNPKYAGSLEKCKKVMAGYGEVKILDDSEYFITK